MSLLAYDVCFRRFPSVSGGSGVIGKAIAVGLARLQAEVILVCRDVAKGRAAAAEVTAETGNGKVSVEVVDLSLRSSVREFCLRYCSGGRRCDVLINNHAFCPRRVPLSASAYSVRLDGSSC
eukprot:RCo041945